MCARMWRREGIRPETRDKTLLAGCPEPYGLRLFGMYLFGQIPFKAHLLDGAQLDLKPIDMLFRIDNHLFQPMAGREIADLRTVGNPVAEDIRIFTLKR